MIWRTCASDTARALPWACFRQDTRLVYQNRALDATAKNAAFHKKSGGKRAGDYKRVWRVALQITAIPAGAYHLAHAR